MHTLVTVALFGMYAATLVVAAEPEKMSVFNHLKSAFFGKGRSKAGEAPKGPPQSMKIISAGMGRTGTSSLKEALTRLGLKTYHMKDGVFDTPGHFDLWIQFSKGEATVDAVIDKMAEDGFNATTDMPACYIHRELLARYPGARVLLSVRRNGDVWAESVRGTIGRNLDLMARVPYRWIPFMQAFLKFNKWLWKISGLKYPDDFDPQTKIPLHAKLARAHDAWIDKVKRSVPRDKLLVFQPRDGWKPLCDFVSPVDAGVAAKCADILASGDAYPHVNDSAMVKTVYSIMTGVSYVVIALIMTSPVWVVAGVFSIWSRCGKQGKRKAKAS